MFRLRSTAALFTVPLVVGVLGTAAAPAAPATPAAPAFHPGTSLTCRGQGVDPDARVRYRSETVIHAPLSTIWKAADGRGALAVLAGRRSRRRTDSTTARSGSRGGVPVDDPGAAQPRDPRHQPGRSPPPSSRSSTTPASAGPGPPIGEGLHIDGVHVWNFTKVKGGVLVRTEETHTGPQVDANVPAATEILRAGLKAWLQDLKTTAEARTETQPHRNR